MTRNNPQNQTLATLGERGLIRRLLSRKGAPSSFIVPPGDDGAVLRDGVQTVLSIDSLSDGVHFKMAWAPRLKKKGIVLGKAVGAKLFLGAYSDLIAMGGAKKSWAMISLAAPGSVSTSFLSDLHAGIRSAARPLQCALAGGDTIRSSKIVLTAAVGGRLLPKKPLRRAPAKPGDALCVVGTVGDAQAGLWFLLGQKKAHLNQERYFIRRFFWPKLYPQAAPLLAETPGVRAAIDLSDSLHESISLLNANRAPSIQVQLDQVPVSSAWKRLGWSRRRLPEAAEDYALLFSASPSALNRLRKKIPFQILGYFDGAGRGVRYELGGRLQKISEGFRHF